MLLAQTFRKLLTLWNNEHLREFPEDSLRDQVPLVLLQVLHRTLHQNFLNGFWSQDSSCETSAYEILTLIDASLFLWTEALNAQVGVAIRAGQDFLHRSR